MTKKCPFPEESCCDRYMSHSKGYLCCRLDEWKKKCGVCPYDAKIRSKQVKSKRLVKGQVLIAFD